MRKSTVDEIRARFDQDVERFSNLETGQTATVDGALAMDLLQPGWRKQVAVSRFLPRMVVVYDYAHNQRQELPGPAVPEIPGLYVAGDWAGHGEQLADAAAASGRRAAVAAVEN